MEDTKQTPSTRKKFYLGWLALGFFQLMALDLLQGCSPQSQAQMQAPAQRPVQQASDTLLSAGDTQDNVPVLRVNRDFFTSPLTAKVTDGADARDSAGAWQDQPPTQAAPDNSDGSVVADFRDHIGCLVLSDLGEARLCFNVMGDVSNLGINDREMQLEGMAQPGCATGAPTGPGATLTTGGFRLVSAQMTGTALSLEFAPVAGCGGANVKIDLQQS